MKQLERNELMRVDGGYMKLPPWVKGSAWMIAAAYIMDHWTDIKSAIVDGYTDGMNSN